MTEEVAQPLINEQDQHVIEEASEDFRRGYMRALRWGWREKCLQAEALLRQVDAYCESRCAEEMPPIKSETHDALMEVRRMLRRD